MHQDLLQFQTCQTFSMSKTKSQDHDTLKSPWLMPWGTLTKIAHFSEILLSHDPFFGRKWPKQLWTKKSTLSKQSSHEKRCFKLEDPLWHATLPRVDYSRKKEKKRMNKRKWKLDCHIMHLRNSIKSKLKSRKSNSKKVKKRGLHKHNSFLLL